MWVTGNWNVLDQQSFERAVRETYEHHPISYKDLIDRVIKLYRDGHLEREELNTVLHYLASLQIEKEVNRKVCNALEVQFCPHHGLPMKI